MKNMEIVFPLTFVSLSAQERMSDHEKTISPASILPGERVSDEGGKDPSTFFGT
jgi:hypothetical protein